MAWRIVPLPALCMCVCWRGQACRRVGRPHVGASFGGGGRVLGSRWPRVRGKRGEGFPCYSGCL